MPVGLMPVETDAAALPSNARANGGAGIALLLSANHDYASEGSVYHFDRRLTHNSLHP